ncbi:MAG: aquaporin family protein [Sedimentisphaerales bacterium]|nr:aquaporin family protein [Sedimentisphaerales bacterium]
MTDFTAEFIGTMILVLLGDGVVANVCLKGTKGNNSGWIVITIGWGLAVFTAVAVVGQFSGAHINPAVTVGLAAAGRFPAADVPLFIGAQFLGGAMGAFLVWMFYRRHFDITTEKGTILGVFATGPEIRNPLSNIFSEIIGTFVLITAVLYMAGPEVAGSSSEIKVGLGSIGAIPVAFVVMAIGLCLGGTTGYAINPARDLGPRLIHELVPIRHKGQSDWGYSWIPVVGPILGALLAAVIYCLWPAV